MLFPELELHHLVRGVLGGLLDAPAARRGATVVHADACLAVLLEAGEVRRVGEAVGHGAEEPLEVGTAEVRPRLQLGQWVEIGADGVQVDVGGGVGVQLRGEVDVDPQELRRAVVAGGLCRLCF